MEISELTIRILLLFFPGIICTLIIDSLTVHEERNTFVFSIHSFVFGLSCYTLYSLEKYVVHQIPLFSQSVDTRVIFLEALTKADIQVDYLEVIKVTVFVSIPLSLIISRALHQKYLHRFAKKIKVTDKFGDIGVWGFVFNQRNIGWIWVRDIKNDLIYQGWLQAFSNDVEENELLLTDVTVFRNSTGDELYKVDGLYLARERNEITIEFPQLKSDVNKSNQEKKDDRGNRRKNKV